MNTLVRQLGCIALAVLATGCAGINPPPPVDVLSTTPPPVATLPRPAGPATGSLFHAASFRPAFEDQRARLIGDMVTITIKEEIDAKQDTKSNVNRAADASGGITALPLLAATTAGKLAARSSVGADYANNFNGSGNTASKNEFKSNITAIVSDVLPNGHLVIAGEKQVGVNRSVDVLRFSGIVDPRRLQPGSIIESQYVANVRVISRGLGEQAEAQAMGWLARAFNTVTPF
ncbi:MULTISPECIES: flagellar basal body L-ring protein FlgH [unclassified Acidovorax]|uniref:flagellar basal body L-ring protein FlgH n=1 Tax=unclassified Acidovorax TaxID=2684926 RepID=UPI000B3FEDAA|nr:MULTISPECIES: flagellar basal body L-ring protein FlgH [unclassified Acidovorax]